MIINQAGFFIPDVLIGGEFIGERVVTVQAAEPCADPQVAVLVFGDGVDPTVADAVFVIWIVFVYFESIAIVAVQSIFSPKPEEAAAILKDGVYRTLG